MRILTDDADRLRRLDAERKRKQREKLSVLAIPQCQDLQRRKRLESDDIAWLMFYFGEDCGLEAPFTYDFTDQQREMIAAIRQAIQYGGDQAIAASRGEGKTTIATRLMLKCVLSGELNFAVIFAATGPKASDVIEAIQNALSENELLIADYPEVCFPIMELRGAPQKAASQKANGVRFDNGKPFEMAWLNYSWCGQQLIFPRVPGSPSSGAIIASHGLDSAVRGLNKLGRRPKVAIIDDPDTEDTARSEEQSKKLEQRIDAAIGGMGGQKRRISRVMLTTTQSRISVSFRFTDPRQKPAFKGRRYRYLLKNPERMDLWEEYIAMRQADQQVLDANQQPADPFARRSHRFYIENRKVMDRGSAVSNPHRFDETILADGSKAEASSLQAYFNEVADKGLSFVLTEWDNDPPEETAVVESGLTPNRIQRQVNGLERRKCPNGTVVITQGIDVRKVALHWVVRAWLADGTGHTVDYGVHELIGTKYGVDEGVDAAVTKAILARMEEAKAAEFVTEGGDRMPIDLTLVDAGWKTDAVYAACLKIGAGIMPVMGFGRSSGCTQANFRDVQHATQEKRPGDGWFLSKRKRLWLVCADADRWKSWEHDRWMTAPNSPGCLYMYGTGESGTERLSADQKSHHSYARHICNESEVEEPYKGVVRRIWKAKSDNTHWLDSSYYADVAANMRGIRLATSSAAVGGGLDQRRTFTLPGKRQ